MPDSMKLGGGGRFKALVKKFRSRGGVSNPAAVAAVIGRKKYGAKKFGKLAANARLRKKISRKSRR